MSISGPVGASVLHSFAVRAREASVCVVWKMPVMGEQEGAGAVLSTPSPSSLASRKQALMRTGTSGWTSPVRRLMTEMLNRSTRYLIKLLTGISFSVSVIPWNPVLARTKTSWQGTHMFTDLSMA